MHAADIHRATTHPPSKPPPQTSSNQRATAALFSLPYMPKRNAIRQLSKVVDCPCVGRKAPIEPVVERRPRPQALRGWGGSTLAAPWRMRLHPSRHTLQEHCPSAHDHPNYPNPRAAWCLMRGSAMGCGPAAQSMCHPCTPVRQ